MKKRVFGLDLVRFLAIILVVMVHSFLHSGFNDASVDGLEMYLLLFCRCLSHCGVLLFILLTGYLNCEKKLDKKYFFSIIPVLTTYLVVSIITAITRKFIFHDNVNVFHLVGGIFNFSTIPYGWYVEMYIGLFFFIPFLNILYKNIPTKKDKQTFLIILFLFSSFFPTLTKAFIAGHSLNLFPDYWNMLYPFLLYFMGCYIKEYQITIPKVLNFILIILILFLNSFLLYFYLHGSSISTLLLSENYIFSIIQAILIFLFCYNIKTYSKTLYYSVRFFSKVSFSIYLISYCFDEFFYNHLHLFYGQTHHYLLCTFLLTPIVFLLSSFAAGIIDYFVKSLFQFFSKLVDVRRKITKERHPYD